jgi:hypothetical protein
LNDEFEISGTRGEISISASPRRTIQYSIPILNNCESGSIFQGIPITSRVEISPRLNLLLIAPQNHSIGLRSGELGGHCGKTLQTSKRAPRADARVWQLAAS